MRAGTIVLCVSLALVVNTGCSQQGGTSANGPSRPEVPAAVVGGDWDAQEEDYLYTLYLSKSGDYYQTRMRKEFEGVGRTTWSLDRTYRRKGSVPGSVGVRG